LTLASPSRPLFWGEARVVNRFFMRQVAPAHLAGVFCTVWGPTGAAQRPQPLAFYAIRGWKSRQTRNWKHIKEVWLNPPREHVVSPEKRAKTV
jgi:hypothetical protein